MSERELSPEGQARVESVLDDLYGTSYAPLWRERIEALVRELEEVNRGRQRDGAYMAGKEYEAIARAERAEARLAALREATGADERDGGWWLPYYVHGAPPVMMPAEEWVAKRKEAARALAASEEGGRNG